MLQIKIPASKLAACIGLNPYCKIPDALLDLYKYKKLGSIEKLEAKKLLDTKSKTALCKLLEIPLDSSTKDIQQNLKKNLNSLVLDKNKETNLLGSVENKELLKSLQSDINMRKGVLNEAKDLNRLEGKKKMTIINRNSKLGSLVLTIENTYEIKITGRTDGYCVESKCLIETKHRKNRLFGKVPLYERLQCEVYMRMFECSQCYHTETWQEQSNEKLLKLDDELWDKITTRLETKFIPQYLSLIHSYL